MSSDVIVQAESSFGRYSKEIMEYGMACHFLSASTLRHRKSRKEKHLKVLEIPQLK